MKLLAKLHPYLRLATSVGAVGGTILVVKLVAAAKELAVSRQFGVSESLDALLMAYLVPALIAQIVAGSVHTAVVPTYIQTKQSEGESSAHQLFSSVMFAVTILVAVVSVALALASPMVIRLAAPGFNPAQLEQAQRLSHILILLLPISGIGSVFFALLNAHERYVLPALTPILTPIVVVAAILTLGPSWGVTAIAAGITAGALLEAIALAAIAYGSGLRVIPCRPSVSPALLQIGRQMSPMVAGVTLTSGSTCVDQMMATYLGGGSVSALNYGNKVSAVVIGVSSSALSVIVLPRFSKLVAESNWAGVRATLRDYRRFVLLTTVPAAIALILSSPIVVSTLFERGAFTARETELVSTIQRLYLLQVPFFALGILHVRLISALKANSLVVWGTAGSFVLNVALNVVFMRQFGLAGIALSTSCVYAASLLYLSAASRIRLRSAEAAASPTQSTGSRLSPAWPGEASRRFAPASASAPGGSRIMFLIRSLNRGGAERQLVNLALGLASRGHRVTVAVFYRGPLAAELDGSAVELVDLAKSSRWDCVAFLVRLVRLVRNERPDVLHGYLGVPNILAIALSVFAPRCRVVWGVRSSGDEAAGSDWLGHTSSRVERFLSRLPHLIIANSYAGLESAVQGGFPRDRMAVVPNGIDARRFCRDADGRSRTRSEWGVRDEVQVIGIVGRLTPEKDHPSFLRACAVVAARNENAVFVSVGDGPEEYRRQLADLGVTLGLSERLIWQRGRTDTEAVYSALDVLVSSSLREGFSNVVAEAMSCGTPCVVTDVGDSSRLVSDCGHVVPPNDPEALAHAICRAIASASHSDDLPRRSRDRVASEFSIERLVERTEALLLGRPRAEGY